MSLHIDGLVKVFGGTRALDGVTLAAPDGEVLALLGHNGAGKSTLIKCLGGAFPPDAGTVRLGGTTYSGLTPRQSRDAGVAIIYQNLNLVDALSVTDNLFLGRERRRGPLVERRAQHDAAVQALAEVGAACSPKALVADLSMGQRQLVAIARAVLSQPQILVLDEPTAALSAREAATLLDRVDALRQTKIAIMYVTHLLGEVEQLADRVVVLKNGAVTHDAPRAGMTRGQLVQAITGRSAEPDRAVPGRRPNLGAVRLEVVGLRGPRFGPVTLEVSAGEVLALHGAIGSGRTRLLETLAGRRKASGGTVRVDGRMVAPRSPRGAVRVGIGLVPGDRVRQGLFLSMRADENVLIGSLARLARRGVRRRSAERAAFRTLATDVALHPADPHRAAFAYSGGNQQKLLLARFMAGERPLPVLLLDEPTQGVDVGAREEIYRAIRDLAARAGCAVLVCSSDPEEVQALADRCLIVAAGRVVAELDRGAITVNRLVSLAHGEAMQVAAPATSSAGKDCPP